MNSPLQHELDAALAAVLGDMRRAVDQLAQVLEAERAALALAEEGTRLADSHLGVSDDTWAQVRKHYDDDQIAALVCLVALVNAANRMNVIVRNPAGSYEPGMFREHVQLIGESCSGPKG